MFPEVTALVRAAIADRYAFLPYLYHTLRNAVERHEPMLRPTFLDHEHDARAWEPSDDFMLGEALLVASVVERGQRARPVYLPDNHGAGWWDWHAGRWHAGGQTITLPAPLERCPLLVRAGSLLVRAAPSADAADASKPQVRALHVFPTPAPLPGTHETTLAWVEDDGVSAAGGAADAAAARVDITCDLACTADELTLSVRATFHGAWRPAFDRVSVVTPREETRPVRVHGECVVRGDTALATRTFAFDLDHVSAGCPLRFTRGAAE